VSQLRSRNVVIAGKRTSVGINDMTWEAFRDIAARQNRTLTSLVNEIDRNRGSENRTNAIRTYIIQFYRAAAAARRET
jgi:predicted DNA-binding ribbon-helix-helix protein